MTMEEEYWVIGALVGVIAMLAIILMKALAKIEQQEERLKELSFKLGMQRKQMDRIGVNKAMWN